MIKVEWDMSTFVISQFYAWLQTEENFFTLSQKNNLLLTLQYSLSLDYNTLKIN